MFSETQKRRMYIAGDFRLVGISSGRGGDLLYYSEDENGNSLRCAVEQNGSLRVAHASGSSISGDWEDAVKPIFQKAIDSLTDVEIEDLRAAPCQMLKHYICL